MPIPPTDSRAFLDALARLAATVDWAAAGFLILSRTIEADPSLLDNPRALRAAFADEMGWRDLHWPWLEEWRAEFARLGVYPRMWHNGSPDIPELLCHVALLARRRDFKFGLVRFGPPLSDEPEPIRRLIERKIAGYADGEQGATLPPFFPGDRTLAQPGVRLRRPPPEGVTICEFRGYGDTHLLS